MRCNSNGNDNDEEKERVGESPSSTPRPPKRSIWPKIKKKKTLLRPQIIFYSMQRIGSAHERKLINKHQVVQLIS